MLKIGIDISQIAHGGGVATYTKELAAAILEDKGLALKFFYASLRKKYQGTLPNVKSYLIPPTILEPLMNRLRLVKIEDLIGQIQVFHSSDWIQPPTNAKKVTTYHDVIPLKFPDWSEPKIVAVHQRRLRLVEQEIDMVIAVTETIKSDLMAVSKIPESKIKVIYEAAGDHFTKADPDAIEQFRLAYKLPEKFALSIGGRGNRRNLDRIKEAVGGFPLVVTHKDLPSLSDTQMPLLYSAASVLIYPSLYEGFGLPILEAFSCELPVITSNFGAMAEVAKDGAILVDPLSVDDINKNFEELMADSGLRDQLVRKGLARAKQFSWQKTAEQTAQVYRSLIEP